MGLANVPQALAVLHSLRIAHLDVAGGNILAGPISVSPDAPLAEREYRFIDFQTSKMWPMDDAGPFRASGDFAQHHAPEMTDGATYDAFPVDVYQASAMVIKHLCQEVRPA